MPDPVVLYSTTRALKVTERQYHSHSQVLYVAHVGDSAAVMACTAYNLHFPLRLTTDHKPNRPDEHARISDAGGAIDERHNRVVSEPKPHNGRVTLLSMSRCRPNTCLDSCYPLMISPVTMSFIGSASSRAGEPAG